MKKRIIGIVLAAVMVFAAAPPGISAAETAAGGGAVTVSADQAGGGTFYIGQYSYDLAYQASLHGLTLDLDTKTSTYTLKHDASRANYWDSAPDLSVAVSGGVVTDIYDFAFGDAGGVKIGDSLDAIKATYGEPLAYEFTDSEMFLYKVGGVYMEIDSSSQSGPGNPYPPVVACIRYMSPGNINLMSFFHTQVQDDSYPYLPVGNGTSAISYGRWLFCSYSLPGYDAPRQLVRVNTLRGEMVVLATAVGPSLYCDGGRIFYTATDDSGNPLSVCCVSINENGSDVVKYCDGELVGYKDAGGWLYVRTQDSDGNSVLSQISSFPGGSLEPISDDAQVSPPGQSAADTSYGTAGNWVLSYSVDGRWVNYSISHRDGTAPRYAFIAQDAPPAWRENNFDVAVFYGTIVDGLDVTYNNVSCEAVAHGGTAYLLMVNGGFMPYPNVVLSGSSTLAPVGTLCAALGLSESMNGQTVTLANDSTSITLTVGNSGAAVNGETKTMPAAAQTINGTVYAPIRFVAEAAGAAVQYVPNINDLAKLPGMSLATDYSKDVKTVVIETDPTVTAAYSVDDGLAAVKKASEAAYQIVKDYLAECGVGFNDTYQKDYDPDAITYTGTDMGRYYVYRLTDFECCPIFYNKYTGEIFSWQPGLPSVFVSKGFTNIAWMYQ